MTGVTIRDVEPEDAAAWRALWQGYLDFYNVTLAPEVTAKTWARILDPDNRLNCRLALQGGTLTGFAVWHHHVASWSDRDDCYLEDLFVAPDARGHGIGRALIDDLAALARARGFGRFYWHTDQDNTRARALYDTYAQADGHVRYRHAL